MSHLTRTDLLAAAEGEDGTLAPLQRRHLETCSHCAEEAARLRTMLAAVREAAPPEPSPLFWTHFSRRIADALDDAPPASSRAAGWVFRPAAAWVILLALTTAAALGWRVTLGAPHRTAARSPVQAGSSPVPGAAGSAAHRATESPTQGRAGSPAGRGADPFAEQPGAESDRGWNARRAVAEGLPIDEIEQADLEAAPGTAERAAADLTPGERAALERLIATELKRRGA